MWTHLVDRDRDHLSLPFYVALVLLPVEEIGDTCRTSPPDQIFGLGRAPAVHFIPNLVLALVALVHRSEPCLRASSSPCRRRPHTVDGAPLLVLPAVFVGAQALAELGSDKIAPGVDLQPRSAEEMEMDLQNVMRAAGGAYLEQKGGGERLAR